MATTASWLAYSPCLLQWCRYASCIWDLLSKDNVKHPTILFCCKASVLGLALIAITAYQAFPKPCCDMWLRSGLGSTLRPRTVKGRMFLESHCVVCKSAGKAWQTPLGRYAPKQDAESSPGGSAWAVALQLPLEGVLSKAGGVHFVLKRAQGSQPEWLSGPDSKDFFVDTSEVILSLRHRQQFTLAFQVHAACEL